MGSKTSALAVGGGTAIVGGGALALAAVKTVCIPTEFEFLGIGLACIGLMSMGYSVYKLTKEKNKEAKEKAEKVTEVNSLKKENQNLIQ